VPALDGKCPPPAEEYASTLALSCVSSSVIGFSSAPTAACSSNRLAACRDGVRLIRVLGTQEQLSIARCRRCKKFRFRAKNTCALRAPCIILWNLRSCLWADRGCPLAPSSRAGAPDLQQFGRHCHRLNRYQSAIQLAAGRNVPRAIAIEDTLIEVFLKRPSPDSNPDHLLENLKSS
jgi:hypothetical protein